SAASVPVTSTSTRPPPQLVTAGATAMRPPTGSHRLTPPAFDQCHTAESVPSATASRTPAALDPADGWRASRPPSAFHPPELDHRHSEPSAPWTKTSTVP